MPSPSVLTLPKGIQALERPNKQGVITTKYRVQLNRRGFKLDKVFDDLNDALEVINASKSITGKRAIKLEQRIKDEENKLIKDFFLNSDFKVYCEEYIKHYQKPRFKEYDKTTAKGIFKLRNLENIEYLCNSICERLIKPDATELETYGLDPIIFESTLADKKLGWFKPIEITGNVLNTYIRKRLNDGIKPRTIDNELQFIRNVFKKIAIIDTRLEGIKIPQHDKDLLLVNTKKKRKIAFRLTDEDKVKFIQALENYGNKELGLIVKLALMTGLRRNELVLLEWRQVKINHLALEDVKGEDRTVFLTPKAQALISTIERTTSPRLFKYTVDGFASSFKYVMKKAGLFHIKTHGIRKESISEFIENIGADNSILISQFLGLKNMENFKERYLDENKVNSKLDTQEQGLNHFGHSNPQIQIDHYFSLIKK
jgi:integrase